MRKHHRILVAAGALLGAAAPSVALAQNDTNPVLNNVLLLVDTSGSMEFDTKGNKVTCDVADPSLASTEPAPGPSQKNRWTQLVEVLTGDIDSFACYAEDRSTTTFSNEYKLDPTATHPPIYDYQYYIPYHRILSGSDSTNYCTVGPGTLPTNAFDWGSDPFHFHRWNDVSQTCTNFVQSSTGILDSYRDLLRFSLMTFDSLPDPGTGIQANTTTADQSTGSQGNWSYFHGWRGGALNGAKGRPAGCTIDQDLEVGVRNAAAPPWEGRMIPFGSPTMSTTDLHANNDHIQQALLAVRPYGATPINGMLSDAREFLKNDDTGDPITGTSCSASTPESCFGPKYDPYITAPEQCRKTSIILLTDGEPNLDLRPFCESAHTCPFPDKSDEIVSGLATPTDGTSPIRTYVLGFAVSTVGTGGPTPVDCTKITNAGTFDDQGFCTPPPPPATMDPALSACCALAKIAFYGGTGAPAFADNVQDLRSAIDNILHNSVPSSSRTVPTFANATSKDATGAVSYTFLSAFSVPKSGLWDGILQRKRTACDDKNVPQVVPVDPASGDDFVANVNSGNGPARQYFTALPPADAQGKIWADRSIRPTLALANNNPDGVGIANETPQAGTNGTNADFFSPKIPAAAMRIVQSLCTTPTPASSDEDCAARVMRWELGVADGALPNRVGNVVGDIFHATPVVVGPPNDFVRDESYTTFSTSSAAAKRPLVLYTGTNDGQLHAFKVGSTTDPTDTLKVDRLENNELWSFFPPAVLPNLAKQYPTTHQVLLDGEPVIKDVVFSRSSADAQAGTVSVTEGWHTVLVGGFGAGGPGYYAVDITNPVVKSGDLTSGPHLLWQLTTDADGNPLFGQHGGTPLITTLFYTAPNTTDAREYAVAVLPGGSSGAPSSGACARSTTTWPLVDASHKPRNQVRCWPSDPARSLTIVNLETGEIVRSFRRAGDGPTGTAAFAARVIDDQNQFATIDSPITGQPVAYPATTGSVADRIFVGDDDGTMWRIDASNLDPQHWRMDLWFDAYNKDAFDAGQPIATPPVLSVDNLGNITAAFSTGDQGVFAHTTGMKNYVYSVREDPSHGVVGQSLQMWYQQFLDGERVSGPMSLFTSALYFSTFVPVDLSSANVCKNGDSRLWGMHYVEPKDFDPANPTANADKGEGGAPELIDPDLPPGPPVQSKLLPDTLIFGVGITQQPSCAGPDQDFTDPYIGFGTHTQLPNLQPGNFQLVVQTGTGGKQQDNARPNTITMPLTPPPNSTRIDSWAAIIE